MRIRKNTSIFSLITLGFLNACFAGPSTNDMLGSAVIGCWYGEDYQLAVDNKVGWLVNRRSDGTFGIQFRIIGAGPNGLIQTEVGRWSYADGRLKTITTTVDGKAANPSYVDEYEVKKIKENEVAYIHAASNHTFFARRVACDYKTQ